VKLMLRADIDKLGRMGEVVNVAEGYARNFLLPRRLAVTVSPENERRIESEKKRRAARLAVVAKEMEDAARKLDGRSITIQARATPEETLYGSVTEKMIVDTLRQEEKIEIDPKWIKLAEPIRKLGIYEVPVQPGDNVVATLKVWVIAEAAPESAAAKEKAPAKEKEEEE
jgi:large subunit ribosomal protein L9